MTSTPSASGAAGSPGVAVIGYAFMGKAHSHAWRNVAALRPGAPGVRQQVLVGRDADAVAAAAGQYGWTESATDWREVLAPRRHRHRRHVHARRHLHAEIAIAALEAGKHVIVREAARQHHGRGRGDGRRRRRPPERGVHVDGRLQLPPRARARAGPRPGRRGPARRVRQVRAAYLQDWLADDAAPMTWRLRREPAGSGALGDLGVPRRRPGAVHHRRGHARSPARSTTIVTERPRRRAAPGCRHGVGDETRRHRRRRRVFTAAHRRAVPSAASRPPDWPPAARTPSASRSTAATAPCASTSRRSTTSTSATHGGRRAAGLPADPRHRARRTPTSPAWWPPGHILGWEHSFTHQARDFVDGASPRAPQPTPVVRGRARRCSACWPRSRPSAGGAAPGSRVRPPHPQKEQRRWRDRSPCSPASGPTCRSRRSPGSPSEWGYDGLEIACWGDHLDAVALGRRRLRRRASSTSSRSTA